MMAAVVRPALFVVAVVLCCVCGCAAATTEGIGDEEQVIVALQKAKGKALEAKEAVNEAKSKVEAIKQATVQFEAEAKTALQAATALNAAVKEKTGNKLADIDGVAGLVNTAKDTTNTSFKCVILIGKKVTEAVEATTRAGQLFTAAQNSAGSAQEEVDEVLSEEAERAQKAFEDLSEVLSALKLAQNSAEETKNAATKDGAAFKAMDSAEKAYKSVNDETAVKPSTVTQELTEAAKEAVGFTTAAVGHAEKASSAVNEASKQASNAVSSAESRLKDIEVALKLLKPREKVPDASPEDAHPAQLPRPGEAREVAPGHGLPQDSLRSTSTSEKSSDHQLTDVSLESTTETHAPGTTEAQGPQDSVSESPKELGGITTTSGSGTSGTEDDTTRGSTVSAQGPNAADNSRKTDAADKNAPDTNANNPLQGIASADSSVSPLWVRTPLLLVVVGVLGLLVVC
ncbi:hypothetical protein DQ04_09141020 [Trypanosoma grayi]|uniref:hypothetical protein n=1 Tax=Trypanosoma grayi TaxID=71804 RepID=UPI0004F446B0|nr:hypothetical protein DQ04_09141020 [Trypanosoma grayi]KEG07668.1 hypothetical protein DQ04_09141020 [Trypanosoma grayi]